MSRYLVASVLTGLFVASGLSGCSDDDVSNRDTSVQQDSTADTATAADATTGKVEQYILASGAVTGWTGDGAQSAYNDTEGSKRRHGCHCRVQKRRGKRTHQTPAIAVVG